MAEAQAQGKRLKVDLLYANRDQNIPFHDELEHLEAENPDLRISYIVQPQTLDASTIKQYADRADNPLIYLSGPEPMVKQFAADLESLGLAKEQVKLDDFPGYERI